MSERDDVQPALTPEEWERVEKYGVEYMYAEVGPYTFSIVHGGPRALAAIALHGHPRGFTWEDVDMLRGAAVNWPYENADRFAALADRIEALLPPRP